MQLWAVDQRRVAGRAQDVTEETLRKVKDALKGATGLMPS